MTGVPSSNFDESTASGVFRDQYRNCEDRVGEDGNHIQGMCTHDLARGVLWSELEGGDGPHSSWWGTEFSIG